MINDGTTFVAHKQSHFSIPPEPSLNLFLISPEYRKPVRRNYPPNLYLIFEWLSDESRIQISIRYRHYIFPDQLSAFHKRYLHLRMQNHSTTVYSYLVHKCNIYFSVSQFKTSSRIPTQRLLLSFCTHRH